MLIFSSIELKSMSTVKRQGNIISRTTTSDSLKVSSPKALDDPSGSSERVDLFQSLSVSLLFANLHIQRVYWFDFPMVFVKIFPRKLYGSAVATSSAPVPGVCPRFVAVMCSTPVPGVYIAFTSAEFQDPLHSHLFQHRGDSFVSRHSAESTASTGSSESPGASQSCASAESLDSVHTLLFRNHVDHSVDLIPESEMDFYALFPGLVEFIVPPGVNLLYGSLPRPPDYCSNSCSWCTLIDLRLNREDAPSKGELWLVQFWQTHARIVEIRCLDITVIGHLSIDIVVYVLRSLESLNSFRQGELWLESFKRHLDFGIARRWLALWLAYHGLTLTEPGLLLPYPLVMNWITLLMLQHHGYTRSFVATQDCVTTTSPSPNREYGLTGHLIVAHSRWFGSVLQFLYGSQPRPPDILFSLFHFSSIFPVFFMSKIKVHLLTFILRGSIRYDIVVLV